MFGMRQTLMRPLPLAALLVSVCCLPAPTALAQQNTGQIK